MGRLVESGLLLLALSCLASPAAAWLDAAVYQARQSRRLDRLMLTGARRDPGPVSHAARSTDAGEGDDGLVGRIEIPRLEFSAMIAEGVDAPTLRRAVGHRPGTPLPGRPGTVVLAGHRDTFFRVLEEVRPFDRVTITTPRGVFDYEVDEMSIVQPDQADILSPTMEPGLALITCFPFHYIGPAPRRYIVHARPVVARRSSALDAIHQRHETATALSVARRSS